MPRKPISELTPEEGEKRREYDRIKKRESRARSQKKQAYDQSRKEYMREYMKEKRKNKMVDSCRTNKKST